MILVKYPNLKFCLKKCIETVTNYRIRYHIPHWNKEKILFTFDDGPLPSTIDVLKFLDKKQKRAVFFLLAENIIKYPNIAKEIIKKGHTVGLHGFNHSNMKKLTLSEFSRQIKESLKIIKDVCGIGVKYFRPPFGQINLIQIIWLLIHGMTLFFWSCGVSDSGKFDFINPKLELREKTGLDNNKLIVLLHDHMPLETIESNFNFLDFITTK